ncbi:MAG TPA: hypothetical protein PK280_05170 [Planctomycetota bacterium]|nr:hypothetical protein [Planctomycetota bacterium]
MKRIYLRLIEDLPSNDPIEVQLHSVKVIVEKLLQIHWEMEPKPDPKGGYAMSGMIPDDMDWEESLRQLVKAGYLVVI